MITEAERELRKNFLGSSDAAAVCGLSPYRTAYDCFLEKTGQVEGFNGNAATHAGTKLEPVVIQWALDQLKPSQAEISPPSQLSAQLPFMVAHLDAVPYFGDEPTILEAKTSGIYSPLRAAEWGDEYSDDVPEIHKLQLAHQFAVMGPRYKRAFVAALLPPRGFVLFVVPRDDEVVDALVERERDFWHNHILANVPPEDCQPSLEVAKRLRRTKGKEALVNWELVADLLRAKADLKAAKEAEDKAQAAILAQLGDAEVGTSAAGVVTYYPTTRKAYSVDETTYRQLRIKEAK